MIVTSSNIFLPHIVYLSDCNVTTFNYFLQDNLAFILIMTGVSHVFVHIQIFIVMKHTLLYFTPCLDLQEFYLILCLILDCTLISLSPNSFHGSTFLNT